MAESSPLSDRDLADFIEAHGIAARITHPGVPTPTVPAAAQAVGTTPDRIVKSLVFIAGEEPVLAIAAGERRLHPPLIARALGLGRNRVRLAGPSEAQDISGFPVGAMPPFGHRRRLPTLVDSESLVAGTVVYGGGGSRQALLEISTDTLLAVTGARLVPLSRRGED